MGAPRPGRIEHAGLLGGLRGWSGVLLAESVDGVLRAASVGIALSPPASVVVLHK